MNRYNITNMGSLLTVTRAVRVPKNAPDTTIHIAIVPRDPANDTIPDNEFLAYMLEVLPPFNLVCVIDKNGDPHFYAPNKKAPKGGGKK